VPNSYNSRLVFGRSVRVFGYLVPAIGALARVLDSALIACHATGARLG